MAPFCPSLPANPLNTAKAWAVPARRNGWALCLWATLRGWSWEQKGRRHSHLGRKLALLDTGGQDLGLTEHKRAATFSCLQEVYLPGEGSYWS